MPEAWNDASLSGQSTCHQWREPGRILGIHLSDLPANHVGGGALRASPQCALVSYWVGDGLPLSDSVRRYGRTVVVHELFHLFGFKHSDYVDLPESGIFMSPHLTNPFRLGDGTIFYPTFDDLDALRCIFPQQ